MSASDASSEALGRAIAALEAQRSVLGNAVVDAALARLPVVPAAARPSLRIVGRKLRPGAAEVARNPRARSALLRAAEKLA